MEQRRRQAAESLAKHSVFSFQIHDAEMAARVTELRELLLATCSEEDQPALLSEMVRDIEEKLQKQNDAQEKFLLEPLRRFEQEMELLLDVGSGSDEPMTEDEEDVSLSQQEEVQLQTPPATPEIKQKKEEEEEVLCGVCCGPDSLENDPIVICELCGVAVHQTCYRLAALPEGDWYCHPCKQYMDAQDIEKSLIPTHELECEACNIKAGAFAPSVDGGWIHVACSMFLPELYVQENRTARYQGQMEDLQVICGVDKLRARRKLRCCFCKKTNEKGACAQCAVGKCTVAYHALCAIRNGIKIRYMDDKNQFGSGCLKHQAKFLQMDHSGDGETDEETAAVEDKQLPKTVGNKQQRRRPRQNSWSSDAGSESDNGDGNEDELESDSEHNESNDSLSEGDDEITIDQVKIPAPTASINAPPPRPIGARSQRKPNQVNKTKRSRQMTLAFEQTKSSPAKASVGVSPPSHGDATSALSSSLPADNRLVLESTVFAPAFYPPTYEPEDLCEGNYEYVMVLISSRPFGLGVRPASAPKPQSIFLKAETTSNPAIKTALDRGVIQDGDEIFALNSQVLRGVTTEQFKKLASTLELPVRCWIRTKRKSSNVSFENSTIATPVNGLTSTILHQSDGNPGSASMTLSGGHDDTATIALGIDWPWVFLRSDGKLAMNVFWRTLDSAFFLRKINKRTFSQLQGRMEEICGVRLDSSHPEYQQVRDLLVMPRRERSPAYLVAFRKTRKQKQTFLSSDIFMGVTNTAEAQVDEQTPIAVGTTVTVAKRTWPGINKLGGAGRVKKVNEERLPGGKTRYTYNVAYVLGGNEKNIERKYISVVDLDAEEPVESEKTHPESTTESDTKNTETDTESLSIRLGFEFERTKVEEKLMALPEVKLDRSPKRRRFQLQFSTKDSTVFCQRIAGQEGMAPAKELLLHRHFDVKQEADDVLMTECFSSRLISMEDCTGDEVDEDGSESENEADEIKTELATLQSQFRAAMASNEHIFCELTRKVEEEYASKQYRQRELRGIRWRNYERMYREMQAAKRQFEDSDNENEVVDGEGAPGGKRRTVESEEEAEESENEDVSCGGMFVNKLKQEGNEVCALCELSGGDFVAADNGSVVHAQCAMFTPETYFKDGVVHGIDQVAPERRRLACNICGGRKGLSKIQCASRKCTLAYHVACAFVNGLLAGDPYYQAWCPRHLKSSGMAHFVEVPDHLNKSANATPKSDEHEQPSSSSRRSRKPNKQRSNTKRKRQDLTPVEVTTAAPSGISSSKSNRKRKRNTSAGSTTNTKRGGSPGQAVATDGQEPRCARRLDIDDLGEDSDHAGKAVEIWQAGRDRGRVYSKKDTVEVLKRDWRGINKPGGVGRVRAVSIVPNPTGGKDVLYDINYIVSGFKEKGVAAKFVREYDNVE